MGLSISVYLELFAGVSTCMAGGSVRKEILNVHDRESVFLQRYPTAWPGSLFLQGYSTCTAGGSLFIREYSTCMARDHCSYGVPTCMAGSSPFLSGYSICMTGDHCSYRNTQPAWPGVTVPTRFSTRVAGGSLFPRRCSTCMAGGPQLAWPGMSLAQEWPLAQQWLWITWVQQQPMWCAVKNTFEMSMYSKEYAKNTFGDIHVCLWIVSFEQRGCAAIYQCPYKLQFWPYNNLRTDNWIFMTLGLEIMPLDFEHPSWWCTNCMKLKSTIVD
jgi:hypothetical protein